MFQSSAKISVIIPFYNEKNTINEVINKCLAYSDHIIAINDGSTDGSEADLSNEKVVLLTFKQNTGKGAALKAGFIKCIELKSDYTITIDADLQHPPELIPGFIENVKDNDIIIGNRLKNKGKMPFQRILSNTITSKLLSLKTGQNILDSQCGYRLYRTTILKDILTSYIGYEAESEILINAAKKGYKIDFLDIPAIYSDEKSKMNPFQAILGFIKVILS